MIWQQTTLQLPRLGRGYHLVTREIESAAEGLGEIAIGLAHVFCHHSSAGLTLNENADPTVRADFESHFNHMVPEGAPYYRHTLEGPDDMPAHLKTSLVGSSVVVPVTDGRLSLGTWQGIYLCEFRDRPARRRITVTLVGQPRQTR